MNTEIHPSQMAKEMYNEFYGIPLYLKTVKECCQITINRMYSVASACDDVKLMNYISDVEKEIKKFP